MNTKSGHSSGRRWMLAAGALAATAGAGLAWWRLRPRTVFPPAVAQFWGQRFERPTGGEWAMQAFRGKPLLLNFWATWCPPCVEELPMIDGFWREHAANGFQVLALAIDQPSSVRRFLDRQPLACPVALGGIEGMDLVRALGNPQGGLPFSVFFDADGNISWQKIGQLTPQDLKSWLGQQT
ncbi:MAG: TlpA family protein disulfide reductase [Limnohabitans sp.]